MPFVLARIFRPTFLEVFQINNLELGTFFSVYGIVAMASYVGGGLIADKIQPRILIGVALIQVLRNMITLAGIGTHIEFAVIGAVILAGVSVDEIVKRVAAQRRSKQKQEA